MKKIKSYIKPFLFRNDGSVSIFAISIILPIFIFNAIFIDAIRVMTAERQLENAVETAIRSAMSNYEASTADYGLFVTDDTAISTFNEVMNRQLYSSEELSGLNNLTQVDITSTSAEFQPQTDILQKEVFEYQVNETMKYQAPIQMAGEFADFLKQSKSEDSEVDDINKVEKFVENFEEIMELIKKRNNLLKEYTNRVNHLKRDTTEKYSKQVIGTETPGDKNNIPKEIKSHMSDLNKYYSRYIELKDKDSSDSEDDDLSEEEKEKQKKEQENESKEIKYYEEAKKEFKNTTIVTAVTIIGTYETAKKDIQKAVFGDGGTSRNPQKNSAMYYNNEAQKLIGDDEELAELKKLILDNEFFTDIENSFDEMDNLFKPNEKTPESISNFDLAKNFGLYTQSSIFYYLALTSEIAHVPAIVKTGTENLVTQIDKEIKKLTDAWKKFEDSMKLYNEKNKDGQNMEDAEEEQESNLGDLFDKINTITNIGESLSADQSTYNSLLNYAEKYKGSSSDGEFILNENKEALFTQAFDKLKDMYSLFTNPTQIKSEIYMNEYAKANFSMKKPYKFTDVNSFTYDTKSLLYIVYGHYVPGANYVHFLMEVVAVMLALNLMEALIKNPIGKLGWVGVALAIANAIRVTVVDLDNFVEERYRFKFFKGKRVGPLVTPSTFASVLFYVRTIDGGFNANKRIRILSGISEKTSVDFTETGNTIMKGSATADVKLLFLPQLFPGEVSGNKKSFEVTKYYNY